VLGKTSIGEDNFISEGSVLGAAPQDLKYDGGPTQLIIGSGNFFGRNVTAHIGTELGGGFTRIGSNTHLDAGCHIAHDCYVDDDAYLGTKVLLAGHIHIQRGALIENLSGAHHFTTVGRFARVGPRTAIRRDVPPFTNFYSQNQDLQAPSVQGIHVEGIEKAGLSEIEKRELRRALNDLFVNEAALATKIEQLVNIGVEGEAAYLCEFCRRSLQGVYGRYREKFRNQTPPEALELMDKGQ